MALLEASTAPPLREMENGAIRVGETRVSLESVVYHFNQGRTPEDIVRSFPTLELRDVYAVVAHYLSHRAVVDAYVQRQEERAGELRREIEASRLPGDSLQAKLAARKAEKEQRP